VDGVSNAFTGWLVDDVKVTGGASCPAAAQPLLEPFGPLSVPAGVLLPLESR
jgi:hypothetical protein